MNYSRVATRNIIALIVFCTVSLSADAGRWNTDAAPHSITWHISNGDVHNDHIEMSGRQMSAVLRYGVDEQRRWHVEKSMVWPLLRTIPNNTHASLMRRVNNDAAAGLMVNGRPMQETVEQITLNGTLEVVSTLATHRRDDRLQLRRIYLPSPTKPALIECYELVNLGHAALSVEWPETRCHWQTPEKEGVTGVYDIDYCSGKAQTIVLEAGDTAVFQAVLSASRHGQPLPEADAWKELSARRMLIDEWTSNLVFTSPDSVLNTMQAFSKIRAMESIYQTKGGPMHGPGGESYYAAIWANDQAEYINPYFPFVGYDYGNQSALNSFLLFARYMNADYKPIPSSIIAEGDSYWNGAGDRGDAAMIAYGASRYALARGSADEARQLWPLIEWCLEYCRRQLNSQGVPQSDSDELEGRFPSGEANLCTASLYYDALLSATSLCHELKIKGKNYKQQARRLRVAIDRYFGHEVEGFNTYRYYDGNDILRAWICIPLCMGIWNRAEATADALFSPRLWTENGLLTQAGDRTFWDRSTLYALRGVIASGETERALPFLRHYSTTRLLGDHVPYAVEAWPEGGQRHLSAESALYGRIFTEGLFGIRPTGFRSFTLTPRLPNDWHDMSLSHIRAFGHDIDIRVNRTGNNRLHIIVTAEGKTIVEKAVEEGTSLAVNIGTIR